MLKTTELTSLYRAASNIDERIKQIENDEHTEDDQTQNACKDCTWFVQGRVDIESTCSNKILSTEVEDPVMGDYIRRGRCYNLREHSGKCFGGIYFAENIK